MAGPAKSDRQGHPGAKRGSKGRFIRHTFLREQKVPAVRALTVSMIELPLGTSLMTMVGQAPLLEIGLLATGFTAITLPTVAVATDPEQLAAGATNTLT